MALEIEHKFLVTDNDYRAQARERWVVRQGFLSTDPERTVRVRTQRNLETDESKAKLTIKGKGDRIRQEFEYAIPVEDANALLELCIQPAIEKIRYIVPASVDHNLIWEVDEFHGDNEGLIVAEIELEHEGQSFDRPTWIGDEVTGDARYFNANLINRPYSAWP